jgi:hypothetical protein
MDDLIACMEVTKYRLAEFYALGRFEKVQYMDFFAELEVVREKLSHGEMSVDRLEEIGCEYFVLVFKALDIVFYGLVDIHGGTKQ